MEKNDIRRRWRVESVLSATPEQCGLYFTFVCKRWVAEPWCRCVTCRLEASVMTQWIRSHQLTSLIGSHPCSTWHTWHSTAALPLAHQMDQHCSMQHWLHQGRHTGASTPIRNLIASNRIHHPHSQFLLSSAALNPSSATTPRPHPVHLPTSLPVHTIPFQCASRHHPAICPAPDPLILGALALALRDRLHPHIRQARRRPC